MKNSTAKQFEEKQDFSLKSVRGRDVMYNRFDVYQKNFFHSIKDHVFTYCEAGTGCGKTTVAVAAALDLLANGEVDKLVYARVADDRSLKLGLLPGTVEEKTNIFWGPLDNALKALGVTPEMVRIMEERDMLTRTVDIMLRGTNIIRSAVILDEVQNMDLDTLNLIFTRCDDDCHIAAIGDRVQKDNKKRNDDFLGYCDFLANSNMGDKCELLLNHRGKFSRLAESYPGLNR